MECPEHFDIFWEKKETLRRDEMETLLSRSIASVFLGSFIFDLPRAGAKEMGSGFSFFDLSGVFTKVVVMEPAHQDELEQILHVSESFREEAGEFFRGRGSRIFQPGIKTRLVLFAPNFEPELIHHLQFYGLKASLVSFSFIEAGGKKGILLRRVEEIGSEAKDEREPSPSSFFERIPLTGEEEEALGRLRPLLRDRMNEAASDDQPEKRGGVNAIS